MREGITFNDKHSYKEFGMTIGFGKQIFTPEKRKILVQVPFSNHQIDFSEIYGAQTYDQRELVYTLQLFNRHGYNNQQMSSIKAKVLNWLLNTGGKVKLYDDDYPNYYFLAEVQSSMHIEDLWSVGKLVVTFTAYPFMVSELKEGHDIWDEINFELDWFQPVDFSVSGSLDISLYNAGAPDVTPTVTASNSMTIEMTDRTIEIPSGESSGRDFILNPGMNDMTIRGNGSISFRFYKELI